MNDFDPVDRNGDGEFDAIDIPILEEEDGNNKQAPETAITDAVSR